jgi:hypothetical protein
MSTHSEDMNVRRRCEPVSADRAVPQDVQALGGVNTVLHLRLVTCAYSSERSYDVDALRAPDEALPSVLRGLSRVLAFPGYAEPGLALRDRTFDDPATRAIVVVKELPPEQFTLGTTTVRSAGPNSAGGHG